ncbi:PREDICTED: myrosinase 1-like isoform X2 [Nicrophorus vespilloides]|uniref:beta-glucosidase n=1 Tax=Nicrophorus vespilloides TaxID=110193 RepID=A0ABM1M8D3_NICVS|nr:PREDICTED: myrosinase 1-like isoform X2 [Nicrophorus vespilloides]
MKLVLGVIFVAIFGNSRGEPLSNYTFPDDFKFGVATASYQVEGAWNLNGKGENVWDRYTHTHPEKIVDGSTGDIACDSYHKYKEDVALCKELGVDFYRFSISWSRLLPTGFISKVNRDGSDYYSKLIDELLSKGIEPMVTMFHWDLPQPLQDLGGWANPKLQDYFYDYARLLLQLYGDRVKYWITFNEPKNVCRFAYGGPLLAPAVDSKAVGIYECAHTILKSHGQVYKMYDEEFRRSPEGKMGISLDMMFWMVPATDSELDKEAAERSLQFNFGWFANPIFGSGDYPEVMKKFVGRRSSFEGFKQSRLPTFSKEELDEIKGSADFLGLNMYSAIEASHVEFENSTDEISMDVDIQASYKFQPEWETAASWWLKVVPWAFKDTLTWVKRTYENPTIIITENGISDKGGNEDYNRVKFYELYLNAMLEAMNEEDVNVIGYTAWSLIDNFEWSDGYTNRFGLYSVDFESPERTRSPKLSAKSYKEIIARRRLPEETVQIPITQRLSARLSLDEVVPSSSTALTHSIQLTLILILTALLHSIH